MSSGKSAFDVGYSAKKIVDVERSDLIENRSQWP